MVKYNGMSKFSYNIPVVLDTKKLNIRWANEYNFFENWTREFLAHSRELIHEIDRKKVDSRYTRTSENDSMTSTNHFAEVRIPTPVVLTEVQVPCSIKHNFLGIYKNLEFYGYSKNFRLRVEIRSVTELIAQMARKSNQCSPFQLNK